MDWIRVSCEYPRHRKTLRLVRWLGEVAITYPIRLWLWAGEQSPDGSLRDLEAEELAMICGHSGDAQELLEAMLETGFVERRDDALWIRSWQEHNGVLFERQQRNSERMREARAQHVHSTSDATKTSVNVRLRSGSTEESQEESPTPRTRESAAPAPIQIPPPLDVDEFRQAWRDWAAYRRENRLKTWTVMTQRTKLDQLAAIGADRAVEAIRHSIANGYQGIFEPKGGPPRATAPRRAIEASSSDDRRRRLAALSAKDVA